jgi:ribosomal protein S18 acetylase RimI-like enzyme
MFASTALGRRIERAEARLSASLGRAVISGEPGAQAFVHEIAGGVAVYTGPASPMNKMIGAGFDGAAPDEELRAVEDRFRERSAPLQAEVATLADPAFVAQLTRRGYILQNFENVLGLPIVSADAAAEADSRILVDAMQEHEAAAWMDAAYTGFAHPDGIGVPGDELPPREAFDSAMGPFMTAEGFRRYVARIGNDLAGVASFRIDDGVAQLCGAATLPAFRRRGVQAALLRQRLADGVKAGCDLAVMTTQPGSTSQQNGQRQGFALLYTRAILVRQPQTTPAARL